LQLQGLQPQVLQEQPVQQGPQGLERPEPGWPLAHSVQPGQGSQQVRQLGQLQGLRKPERQVPLQAG